LPLSRIAGEGAERSEAGEGAATGAISQHASRIATSLTHTARPSPGTGFARATLSRNAGEGLGFRRRLIR